jgi:CDP-glucose 4,6-dehydratase
MEGLGMTTWKGKRVFLTGHTGFKGSWLSLWLQIQGAEVCGYALEPPTRPNLFEDARVSQGMRSFIGDIRNAELLQSKIADFRPEIVFHLAAQPLVRSSYEDPLGTYATNVMGTAHLLEAVRKVEGVRAVVVVTTDKCYENHEWEWAYREIDRLGGYDPYSNSKACVELVVSAYRNSFFHPSAYQRHGVAVATVRAGNVIGGGDWAEDRLVPDIMRAFAGDQPVHIRNPRAIRPWQHVLEPLRGYLTVAESLYKNGPQDGEGWNFGPDPSDARPVEWVVRQLAEIWGGSARWEMETTPQPHEAQNLKLDCSKAAARLDWKPQLQLHDALLLTADWYHARHRGEPMHAYTSKQIQHYIETAPLDTARGDARA